MSAATTTDVIRFLGLSDVADTTTGQASFPLGILYPYSQDLRRVCACYDDLADEDPGTAAALLGGRWRARRVARSQGPNSRVTPRGHRHAPPSHRVRARSRRRLGRSRLPTGVRHARVPQVVDRPERPQTVASPHLALRTTCERCHRRGSPECDPARLSRPCRRRFLSRSRSSHRSTAQPDRSQATGRLGPAVTILVLTAWPATSNPMTTTPQGPPRGMPSARGAPANAGVAGDAHEGLKRR